MRRVARLLAVTCASAVVLAAASASAADETASPASPARAFADGRVFLSVDDAFPLVSMGAASPRGSLNALKLGDPAGLAAPAHAMPLALDVQLAAGITLGGAVLTQHDVSVVTEPASFHVRERVHYTTLGARVGWLYPIARRLAVWPRFGGTWTALPERLAIDERWDVRFDANLAIVPRPSWALLAGPSVIVPLSGEGRGGEELNAEPRIAVTGGLVGRLDPPSRKESDGNEPRGLPRVVVGVERIAPLVRYDIVESESAAPSPGGNPPSTTVRSVSAGLIDSTRESPTSLARGAVDVRIVEGFTVGTALAMGWLRSTQVSTLVPGPGTPTGIVFAASPRLGFLVRVSDLVLVWPRLGMTYARADLDRPDVGTVKSYQLSLDVGAPVIFEVVPGFGFAVSPDVSLPFVGGRSVVDTSRPGSFGGPPTTRASDTTTLSMGLSLGVVASL